ncbi:hypothetical protein BOTCAL_0711g00050 [Botryotinia calthae]|uniref:Uncharacterized protein n=1 Tax=Botryotinia calthae TaxID=38488 RepID=A0A4Y8CJ27_9HELO|nr:hypothetical protein BOTCAL_0711g00050 [Botryotinia calthae]
MSYKRLSGGAFGKAIPDMHQKVETEPANTRKRQETDNTGITVENHTITPGYFGPYANASISPKISPGSNTFEWHKSRRRVLTAVDKVLIEDLQKMQIARILERAQKSAFIPQSTILNGRLQQKFLAQKNDEISERDRKLIESGGAGNGSRAIDTEKSEENKVIRDEMAGWEFKTSSFANLELRSKKI